MPARMPRGFNPTLPARREIREFSLALCRAAADGATRVPE